MQKIFSERRKTLMDRMIEEVVKRKSMVPSEDLKALLKEKRPGIQEPMPNIDVEYEFVTKVDSTKFAACPIIEADDGYYFCTFDGRDLMFDPKQASPYIFLPFPLRRAIFHRSGDRVYFITLDTSNKLQYSLLVDGYPSEERYVISRNVLQVTKQSNRVFYVSTKNELLYINMVVEDGGTLRGRMCISGIKSKPDIGVFYANSTLFLNVGSVFQREDGKELPVQGNKMCEIGGKILILDGKEEDLWLFLLDEKYTVVNRLEIPAVGRSTDLFPLGDIVGIVARRALYLIAESNGNLFVAKEVALKTPPLYISLYLKENVIRISEIVGDEASLSGEASSFAPKDSVSALGSSIEKSSGPVEATSPEVGDEKADSNNDCIQSDVKFPSFDDSPYPSLLLGGHERTEEGYHDTTKGGNGLSGLGFSADDFSPYVPDRSHSAEIKFLSEKINAMLKTQQDIVEKMNKVEKDNSERFKRLVEMMSRPEELQKKYGTQELSRGELHQMMEILSSLGARLRSESSNESKVLDCVKKIILGTLVPAVEAAMDEIRIQIISEIRLIHSDDHLKNVKKAVDCLHSSFNKQNEIKSLISEGLIEEAAEIAVKGSEANLEAFISNVEISCLEHLASSMLVALLERVLVMAKDDFKPSHQNFTYMVMMCLEPNDLSDEEIQVLEILMTYIDNIEDLPLSDVKGLSVLLDFQRLKLNKIKDKRGIK